MLLVLSIVSLFSLVSSEQVVFKDCGSVKGKINVVDITPCPSEPCALKKGTNITVSVNFLSRLEAIHQSSICRQLFVNVLEQTISCSDFQGVNTGETTTQLTAVVHGIIAGIPVPFPLANPDGCKDCGITCPISSGTTYTYTTSLAVLKDYPSIQVVVKWELKDSKTDDVFCFAVPVQIVS